jgi:molybdopterin-containing oxidoreductase family iron-sulfur binding subunit
MSKTKDQNYWRSFRELHGSPKFQDAVNNEFQQGASDSPDLEGMSQVSRRKFMGLMAASTALAGTACTDYRDEGEIHAINNATESTIPGKAVYYASTIRYSGASYPVLVKSREGRPIKINANKQHPIPGVNSQAQAFIGSLYDPNRLKEPVQQGKESKWEEALASIKVGLSSAQSNGKEIAIVTKSILSATQKSILDSLLAKYSNAKLYSYELFNHTTKETAFLKSYGTSTFPSIAFDKAQVVLSLESDFLGVEGAPVAKTKFIAGRDVKDSGNQNRLYSIESDLSITGMNSDYRMSLVPQGQLELVLSLIAELTKKGLSGLSAKTIAALSSFDLASVAKKYGLSTIKLQALTNDLLDFTGKSIVVAGDNLPEEVHVAVNALNVLLGAEKLYTSEYQGKALVAFSDLTDITLLAKSLQENKVGVFLAIDANPVFDFGARVKLGEAIAKADVSVSLALSLDETAAATQWALPINHALEAWGETSDLPGVINLQQPLIAPLYNSRQSEDILIALVEEKPYADTLYREFVKNFFKTEVYTSSGSLLDAITFWNSALHDGFVKVAKIVEPRSAFQETALIAAAKTPISPVSEYTVVLKQSNSIGDGTLANIGWLQELPDPISKITWDNYASMSPATMKKLGLMLYPNSGDYDYDLVDIDINGRKVTIPAFAQPGLAEGIVSICLGYGRTHGGIVLEGVGFDANSLLGLDGFSPTIFADAKVTRGIGTYQLASIQEHNALDLDSMPVTTVGAIAGLIFAGDSDIKPLKELIKDAHLTRGIVKEATLEEYQKDHHVIGHKSHLPTFTMDRPHKYTGVKWEMLIDQNKCTGCGECVISCNVENNIPVVGKDQVIKGREMHWLRIDRYYAGTPEDPQVSTQPMLCQQCDNAPCENVCPVVATTHSPDGINEMTYNRCVGTRYCANNCPYKVRRFNFYNFRDHFKDAHQEKPVFALMTNPEVTVRSRGVMEKCNFCVQRLREGSAEAKRSHKVFDGSGVEVACQEVCPTDAIYFGNINDPKSKVAQYREHDLSYRVLEEIGVRPNVNYIAKLRNVEGKAHS